MEIFLTVCFVPLKGLLAVELGTMAIFALEYDDPFANPAKFFFPNYLRSKIAKTFKHECAFLNRGPSV